MNKFSGLTLYSANTKILEHSLRYNQSIFNSNSSKSIYEPAIQDEAFYHGYLSQPHANIFLKHHGQFLVRKINENKNSVSCFFL